MAKIASPLLTHWQQLAFSSPTPGKNVDMTEVRIALAQLNPTVGDLAGNAALIRQYARRAADAGAAVVAFPELALNGYPVEDLVFRETFVAASRAALRQLATDLAADGLGELVCVVGYLDADGPTLPGPLRQRGAGPRNSAAIIHRGEIVADYRKFHLPTYGVFDEDRYFVPGTALPIVRLRTTGGDVDMAVVICEDIWQAGGPIATAAAAQANLVIAINASPYERNKDDVRLALCQRRAGEAGAPLAFVNMIAGQDDLVFDGDSLIVSERGELLARARQFEPDLLVAGVPVGTALTDVTGPLGQLTVTREQIDVSTPTGEPSPAQSMGHRLDDVAEVYHALVLGLRDYVHKNGFSSVLLGVSGGIDSALVAAIACDAIGAENVYGVAMPSIYSSEHSLTDAKQLVANTGLQFRIVPIADIVAGFQEQLKITGLAEENLQARVRGTTLMAISNAEGHLVLATGNKSEFAVGYSTLYGDAVGGFAPIKDVYKTLVWELARWRNRQDGTPPIPENSIAKPPSAELRPDQVDTDSLPDYAVLDAILARYVDHDEGRAELIAAGYAGPLVDRIVSMVDAAEYKRRQTPPGTKITLKAFGRDRRLPMTNQWREPSDP